MKLPFSILFGSVLALIFSISSFISVVVLNLTAQPGLNTFGNIAQLASAYSITILGMIIAAVTSYMVLKGSEIARTVYLVWTAAALTISMSLTNDPLVVVVEATLGIVVLFFWFLPSASEYLLNVTSEDFAAPA